MWSWSFDPAALLGVAVLAVLYAAGFRRARGRPRQVVCFASGLAVILLALCSPVAALDQELFSLHMIEHLLLTLVAPPLLLLGRPILPFLWGLPSAERRGAARLLHAAARLAGNPVISLTVFSVIFAIWHIPALYDAAQGANLIHYAEHTSFFVSALMFWWPVIHPQGGPRRLSKVAGIGYFSVPMLEGTFIGALLTFSAQPLYATYRAGAGLAGLSAIDDQQLAGLLMWIPGGLVYALAACWLLVSLLHEEELAERRLACATEVAPSAVLTEIDPSRVERLTQRV